MNESTPQRYTAFNGQQLLATGLLEEVALSVKDRLKVSKLESIQIFSDLTGKEMDLDLRGSEAEILQRLHVFISPAETGLVSGGPGRPRLGVVAPGSLSIAATLGVALHPVWRCLSGIAPLADEAKKNSSGIDRVRRSQGRTHAFMTAIAGNLPQYEEALRALYADDGASFEKQIANWPKDIKRKTQDMAADTF